MPLEIWQLHDRSNRLTSLHALKFAVLALDGSELFAMGPTLPVPIAARDYREQVARMRTLAERVVRLPKLETACQRAADFLARCDGPLRVIGEPGFARLVCAVRRELMSALRDGEGCFAPTNGISGITSEVYQG